MPEACGEAEGAGRLSRQFACPVNGAPHPPPFLLTQKLVERGRCALGLVTTGNLSLARQVVRMVRERNELHRIVLGTATPSSAGVMTAGVQMLIGALAGSGEVKPEEAIALATGNTARAFGLPGGRVAVGQPAALLLARLPDAPPPPPHLPPLPDVAPLHT